MIKKTLQKILLAAVAVSLVACASPDSRSRAERKMDMARLKTQLAVEYMRMQDYRNAVQAINEAIQAESGFDYAWMIKGIIYQSLKSNDEAEVAFRQALSISPKSAEINNNYGWFLCSSGRPTAAIPYFDRALEDPTYPTPHIATMNKGICAGRAGQYGEAASYLAKARATAPWFAPVIKEIARLQLMQGQNGNALKLMNQYQSKVEVLGPDDLLLGWKIARANGDTQAAYEYEATLRTRFPGSDEMKEITGGF